MSRNLNSGFAPSVSSLPLEGKVAFAKQMTDEVGVENAVSFAVIKSRVAHALTHGVDG